MPIKYRRFKKTDEDDSFVEVKAEDCAAESTERLEPLSDNGCWRQKSTGKLFHKGAMYAVFEDGTTNREDFEWIEY